MDRGLTDDDREKLRIEMKMLEKQYAEGVIKKIEELEKLPEKKEELEKIIAEVKKTIFYSCKKEDIDANKTPADQAKICLGYFINPKSATIAEAVSAAPDNLFKSMMKYLHRPHLSPDGKGGKRSRKYKRKSIKKSRKKSRRNIKKK